MTNTQLLRFELMKRLRAAHPQSNPDDLADIAEKIEATGAYVHNGETIVPSGTRAQHLRAEMIDATVCGNISRDFVAAAGAASANQESIAYDRTVARLRSLGIDAARAFSGEDDDSMPREFCGVDLNDYEPRGAA